MPISLSNLSHYRLPFFERLLSVSNTPPVAIGGLGGSGTRLIAAMLHYLGFYLGANLNESLDNLWFTLLFKRPELLADQQLLRDHIGIFVAVMTGVPFTSKQKQQVQSLANQPVAEFSADWATMMVSDLLQANQQKSCTNPKWGWKEPNTHVFLLELFKQIPSFRYIHVMRNGLDMAFSNNKNQLHLWGEFFLNKPVDDSAKTALRYWVVTQQRIVNLTQDYPDRILLINYDNLCINPAIELDNLLPFLSLTITEKQRHVLLAMPTLPKSLNRHRAHHPSCFNAEDVTYVESLGFKVDFLVQDRPSQN